MLRLRGFAAAVAVGCGALAWTPSTAISASPVSVTAAVSVNQLRSTGNRSFALTVTIANPGAAERVSLALDPGRWSRVGDVAGNPLVLGAPTASPGAAVTPFPPPPTPAPFPWRCIRGSLTYGLGYFVSVSAQHTVTVTFPVRAVVPAWPGTDYTPQVRWSTPGSGPVSVAVPRVAMTGPRGVHIRVRTQPAGGVARGAILTITGETDPPVRHRMIQVAARIYSESNLSAPPVRIRIARVRTDSHGRFRVRGFHPRRAGMLELVTRLEHPGHGRVADGTCAPTVQVDRGRANGLL